MDKKPVVDKRVIRLEEVMSKDYIPFLGGRPEREKVISYDDIMNLKIKINLEETVEDFIKTM